MADIDCDFVFFAQFTVTPISAVPLVTNAAWTAALIQFFWRLGKAGREIRSIRAAQWRGFEVLDTHAEPEPKPIIKDAE